MKSICKVTMRSMIMVAFLLSGCGDSSNPEPEAEPNVDFRLTAEKVSGGDQTRWRIQAVASNRGDAAAFYFPAHYSEIGFSVYHDSGIPVNVYDPSGPDPRRPLDPFVLCPGASVESELELDGRYWDSQDVEHVMPPGTYRIKTTFTYFSDRDEPRRTLRREKKILWE